MPGSVISTLHDLSHLILSTPLSLNNSHVTDEAPEDERGAIDFSKSHSSTGAWVCLTPEACLEPLVPTVTETLAATAFQTGEGTPGQETRFPVNTAVQPSTA